MNYTFIIPHKNSTELLERCVNSIPLRDDIEIIVVDDNSSPEERPTICREHLKIIYLTEHESHGAGHARNIGLKDAKGKWVLFADADDTYTEHLNDFLNKHVNNTAEVIYFNFNRIKKGHIVSSACSFIEMTTENDKFKLQYRCFSPWNKMVKRSFLVQYDIKFEECPVGNDIFYTYQVAYWAKDNIIADNTVIYNYYITSGSITHRQRNTADFYITCFKHRRQTAEFYTFIGFPQYRRNMLSLFVAILYKRGWQQFLFALRTYMTNYVDIQRDKLLYVNHFCQNNPPY